jgi:hypothetical protein
MEKTERVAELQKAYRDLWGILQIIAMSFSPTKYKRVSQTTLDTLINNLEAVTDTAKKLRDAIAMEEML